MTNRELLEMAAKAAGITIRWERECGVIRARQQSGGYCGIWNPLADDGDALRLVVALRISIDFASPHSKPIDRIQASARSNGNMSCIEKFRSDELVATRRVITRAAAEIGKAMP